MAAAAAPDPDLQATVAALLSAGARFVVIGGFAVIANDYVRATEDVALLIPTDDANDTALDAALLSLQATWQDGRLFEPGQLADRAHARLLTSAGILDLLREGAAPLDFESVSAGALTGDLGDGAFEIGWSTATESAPLAGQLRCG